MRGSEARFCEEVSETCRKGFQGDELVKWQMNVSGAHEGLLGLGRGSGRLQKASFCESSLKILEIGI